MYTLVEEKGISLMIQQQQQQQKMLLLMFVDSLCLFFFNV